MFYTHKLHALEDDGLHLSTLYLVSEIAFSPNTTELPFMCDQEAIICLTVPRVQSSFFPFR